mmetsp:Transcript_133690/g.236668  ORF Transcript_133690/g.236668 Transcript_133690/m.236668 type:complete len:112 (+) Transcript_133690:496-831(+)
MSRFFLAGLLLQDLCGRRLPLQHRRSLKRSEKLLPSGRSGCSCLLESQAPSARVIQLDLAAKIVVVLLKFLQQLHQVNAHGSLALIPSDEVLGLADSWQQGQGAESRCSQF